MTGVTIREARIDDLPYINDLLNYAIINTNYNLSLEPRSIEEAEKWFQSHREKGYLILVAEYQNEVVGWCSFSEFRSISGYKTTAEISVYISQKHRHKGIGTMLITELERNSKQYHQLLAVVTDNNTASIALFTTCGFSPMFTFHEAGFKNGKYRSVTFMIKRVN